LHTLHAEDVQGSWDEGAAATPVAGLKSKQQNTVCRSEFHTSGRAESLIAYRSKPLDKQHCIQPPTYAGKSRPFPYKSAFFGLLSAYVGVQ
jgi:hypothetical protein